MVSLVELLTSWEGVYVMVSLPAVLMLMNFACGSCFISEVLSAEQHSIHSVHTRHRILGRTCVALITASFAWQFYTVMFVARQVADPKLNPRACNLAYFIWDTVDALPIFSRAPLMLLLKCSYRDTSYLLFVSSFFFFYIQCVFSVPQINAAQITSHAPEMRKKVHFCRKCGAYTYLMDHHCYFICNCVGEKNMTLFICCLLTGILNMSYLLLYYGKWAFSSGDLLITAGAVLVMMFNLFLVALLSFHVWLRRSGNSTVDWLHRRRKK